MVISIYGIGISQKNEIDSPVENFEILWKEFNNRYANFELKKVDWDSIYHIYRPMVNDSTSNTDLFKLCCHMVQTLRDGHVTIEAEINNESFDCGSPYTFSLEEEFTNEKEWNHDLWRKL